MGPYHSAVITTNGELYTMGCGKYGALGQDKEAENEYLPSKINFFSEKNLKVTDAVCGEHHTIVVTENGELWSFGFGGSYDFAPLDWLHNRTGALGSGKTTHRFSPGKIEGVSKPVSISSGDRFAIAVSENGDVYNWGCG